MLNFDIFLQITKIETKSTQEGTEIERVGLVFYYASIKTEIFYVSLLYERFL